MAYIKKLVMKGFKSFAKETEIPFSKGMNTVVGPNGAGKSNVSDALCFALGRLSIKSMRATRAANLIFMGTKAIKPSHEASVEIIFDNSDKRFNIDKDEVSMKRIVRNNGQSIYKIGNETKTRQEVLELLAQAEIDPNGFNIILQGEIDSFVKMHTEERRGIIEEVAGISVYEKRKEKSLHELEKTDEKLKEIGTILRERGAYLNNLEEDRKNALKFRHLEETLKKCKASIIFKDKSEKEKGIEQISLRIEGENKKLLKFKESIDAVQQEIGRINEKIELINKHIQDSSGLHSEKLHEDVSNLKVEVGGLSVRKEGLENSLDSLLRRRDELKKSIVSEEKEIEELKKRSPAIAKKQDEIRKKKSEFERVEELRKKFYTLKSEIGSVKNRIADKKDMLRRIHEDSDSSFRQIEEISKQLFDKKTEGNEDNIRMLREKISAAQKEIEELGKSEISAEKNISMNESEIKKLDEIKHNVSKIDICPLCKSKITKEHVEHLKADADKKAGEILKRIDAFSAELNGIKNKKSRAEDSAQSLKSELSNREIDKVKIQSINDRAEHIKRLEKELQIVKKETDELENKRKELERLAEQQSGMDERYENLRLNIEEISSRTEESIDIEISSKERELDRIRFIVKKSLQDEQEIKEQVSELASEIDEKQGLLDRLEDDEKNLTEQFKKHLAERNKLQDEIREKENLLINRQHELRRQEDVINDLRIVKAQLDAEHKSLSEEFSQFQIQEAEIINASREKISERIAKMQEDLIRIGNVNMRAIEVYDSVKSEYDVVLEKAQKLEAEKNEVMKIIQEIDNKKKKTFNKTLDALNILFERNFAQLSTKGTVSLEPESKDDPFSAGVYILVKVGKGKYLDATSLSGGEQTLVALSLIFAIQEYKPYSFYIFDEIDAALDKRNSERLAELIKRYMQSGQYIVITHNDSIITESDVVYGVSMYEGVSKIYSLPV